MDIKDKILNFVHKYPDTTFVDLSENIEGFNGDALMCISSLNIVLWAGMSEKAVRAITALVQGDKIKVEPTAPLTYLIDGKAIDLPPAQGLKVYKKEHWLPLVFNPIYEK